MKKYTQRIIAYCRSTVKITTVSYQHYFYFYLHEIELKKFIIYYFSLNCDDYLPFIVFYIKLSRNNFFLTNIESVLLWYFLTICFGGSQRIS